MLQHSVLDLLLCKVDIVWEQIEELLPCSTFPFFFLLQFQVSHVNSRIELACNSVEEYVDADVERML